MSKGQIGSGSWRKSATGSQDGPIHCNDVRHGCNIELDLNYSLSIIRHIMDGHVSIPTIRSYSDGVKVGCTFLSTDALNKLHTWHTDFLKSGSEKTHQL